MDLKYSDIVTALKQRFPEGTVKFRSDNNRPYIPNQVYTDRLESVTASRWNLEIRELDINAAHKYVKAVVRVHIEPHFRDGYGFAPIDGNPGEESWKIATAVDHAVNEAFLTALDSYEMGWKDLAPYKQQDWAGNPALKHLMEGAPPPEAGSKNSIQTQSFAKSSQQCVKCGKNITKAELKMITILPKLNLIYCFEHLPNHWRRELPQEVLNEFESKQET